MLCAKVNAVTCSIRERNFKVEKNNPSTKSI